MPTKKFYYYFSALVFGIFAFIGYANASVTLPATIDGVTYIMARSGTQDFCGYGPGNLCTHIFYYNGGSVINDYYAPGSSDFFFDGAWLEVMLAPNGSTISSTAYTGSSVNADMFNALPSVTSGGSSSSTSFSLTNSLFTAFLALVTLNSLTIIFLIIFISATLYIFKLIRRAIK